MPSRRTDERRPSPCSLAGFESPMSKSRRRVHSRAGHSPCPSPRPRRPACCQLADCHSTLHSPLQSPLHVAASISDPHTSRRRLAAFHSGVPPAAEVASLEPILRREAQEAASHLIADVEDEHVRAATIALVEQLRFHGAIKGRSGSRAMGIAISVGPSFFRAVLNAALISSLRLRQNGSAAIPFCRGDQIEPRKHRDREP